MAVYDATQACRFSHWKEADYIDTLATAYAEAGDFDSAIKYEGQAIQVVRNNPSGVKDAPGAERQMRGRIEMFKQHRPPYS
jgi:hypothetical protein